MCCVLYCYETKKPFRASDADRRLFNGMEIQLPAGAGHGPIQHCMPLVCVCVRADFVKTPSINI